MTYRFFLFFETPSLTATAISAMTRAPAELPDRSNLLACVNSRLLGGLIVSFLAISNSLLVVKLMLAFLRFYDFLKNFLELFTALIRAAFFRGLDETLALPRVGTLAV
jgi:hypothetical protein